jgi:hypothetical protein
MYDLNSFEKLNQISSPAALSIHMYIHREFCFEATTRNRVTRLGEFSPIGRLFSLSSYLKITKVPQFYSYFFHGT